MNLGIENEYQEFKESLGQLDKGLKYGEKHYEL